MLRYAITDRYLLGADSNSLLEACTHVAAEADFLQIRERDWSARELELFCVRLTARLAGTPRSAGLLINHRLDVALAVRAAGVHLRSGCDELGVAQVRESYARAALPSPVVSVACHSVQAVTQARESGADIALFSPVFGKVVNGVDVSPAAGLAALREAVNAAGAMPVLALGGVNADNMADCLKAGAAGVASIRMYFGHHRGGAAVHPTRETSTI